MTSNAKPMCDGRLLSSHGECYEIFHFCFVCARPSTDATGLKEAVAIARGVFSCRDKHFQTFSFRLSAERNLISGRASRKHRGFQATAEEETGRKASRVSGGGGGGGAGVPIRLVCTSYAGGV